PGLGLGVDETGGGLLGALLGCRLREIALRGLLLGRRDGGGAGLHELVDFRHVGLQVDLLLLVLAERAVADPGLDDGELARGQVEARQVLAEREPERVERLVVLALQLRAGGERARGGEPHDDRSEYSFRHDGPSPLRPVGGSCVVLVGAANGARAQSSYLKESFTLAPNASTLPFSRCMSSCDTSATRRSRSVFDAFSTAAFAAFSQESVLVPTSSMILYTLSAIGRPPRVAAIALVGRLEQPGGPPAAADAHGDDAPPLLLASQLVEQGPGHPAAGHAVRVADRDRAPVRVELLRVDAEPVAAVDDLGGEGLVQLDDVDVLELHAGVFEQLRHGEDRADSHLVGLAAGEHAAAEDPERPDAERLRALGGHDQRRRRTVGELRRVPRRHRAALLERGR